MIGWIARVWLILLSFAVCLALGGWVFRFLMFLVHKAYEGNGTEQAILSIIVVGPITLWAMHVVFGEPEKE